MDEDVSTRLAKASSTFRSLSERLRNGHAYTWTQSWVFKTSVISTWLLGNVAWTVHCRHIAKLDQFHMCCIQCISYGKWQDNVPSTQFLNICGISGIEVSMPAARLR